MDSRQKLKRMVNELMDMQTDAMTVYINVYRDAVDAEFYNAEFGVSIARELEWDSFYTTTEAMIGELNETVKTYKKRQEKGKCTQA